MKFVTEVQKVEVCRDLSFSAKLNGVIVQNLKIQEYKNVFTSTFSQDIRSGSVAGPSKF